MTVVGLDTRGQKLNGTRRRAGVQHRRAAAQHGDERSLVWNANGDGTNSASAEKLRTNRTGSPGSRCRCRRRSRSRRFRSTSADTGAPADGRPVSQVRVSGARTATKPPSRPPEFRVAAISPALARRRTLRPIAQGGTMPKRTGDPAPCRDDARRDRRPLLRHGAPQEPATRPPAPAPHRHRTRSVCGRSPARTVPTSS